MGSSDNKILYVSNRMNHIESATTMLASRGSMLNVTHFLYAPQTTSVGNTAVLLPEVVLVRRELLLASWHFASLCSLFTVYRNSGSR